MKGTPVIEREIITIPAGWPVADRRFTVLPRCDLGAGTWGCITHKELFRNNLEASSHEDDDAEHGVVWLCDEHGPEVP